MPATDVEAEAPPQLPVVLVRDADGAYRAARAIVEVAGARVTIGWELPERPWDLAAIRLVVLGSLGDGRDGEHLVSAVVRGAGAIVGVDRASPAPARPLESLRRAAPLLDWCDCPTMRLDPTQVRLLAELANGASAGDAAEMVHVSLRTAHRRIAEARDLLGASTTNAAAAELALALRHWLPRALPGHHDANDEQAPIRPRPAT
jgi:hypothetical protein